MKKMEENSIGNIGENIQKGRTEVVKRTIKDSVFTDLFQDKKYLLHCIKRSIRKIMKLQRMS